MDRLNLTTNAASIADIRSLLHANADVLLGKFKNESSISQRVSVEATLQHIKKFVDLRIECIDGGRLRGLLCLCKSSWDSKHFGIEIGKITDALFDPALEMNQRSKMFDQLMVESKGIGLRMVFGRLPLRDTRSVHAAEEIGARMMDILLTLHRNLSSEPMSEPDRKIDKATRRDLPYLRSIAADVFSIDQFHANEFLDSKKSSLLFSEWISNSLIERKHTVLVIREKEKPVGFIVVRLHSVVLGRVVGVIDLVGTHPKRMGQGIGSALVSGALNWFSSRVKSVYVGTQAANSSAIRLYEKFAFRNVFAEATFHMRT